MSASDNPTIRVLGSTGLMGREVVRSLNERGVHPRVLVRAPGRLRPTDQVEIHRGDLRDPASLRGAMRGVDAVFHISPHEADGVELTPHRPRRRRGRGCPPRLLRHPHRRLQPAHLVLGDGDGATASIQGGGWAWGGNITYNGCVAEGGIADGVSVKMTVCDWVWSPAQQMRTTTGCRNDWFTS